MAVVTICKHKGGGQSLASIMLETVFTTIRASSPHSPLCAKLVNLVHTSVQPCWKSHAEKISICSTSSASLFQTSKGKYRFNLRQKPLMPSVGVKTQQSIGTVEQAAGHMSATQVV